MGKSFDPIGLVEQMRDAKRCSSTPRPIVSMSFQLAIPWRVALPQSPPLLHQPGASMNERAAAGQQKPANGQLCLNYLSHPRGQVHSAAKRRRIVAQGEAKRNPGSQPHQEQAPDGAQEQTAAHPATICNPHPPLSRRSLHRVGDGFVGDPWSYSDASARFASRTSATASFKPTLASASVVPWVLAPGSSSTNPMYPSGTRR